MKRIHLTDKVYYHLAGRIRPVDRNFPTHKLGYIINKEYWILGVVSD